MWPLRSRQFRELIDRQMAHFDADHQSLIAEARQASAEYHEVSDGDAAMEHYGRHDELAEQLEDALDTIYRSFASTLEPDMEKRYRRQLIKAAKARYGDLLPRLSFDAPDDQLPS